MTATVASRTYRKFRRAANRLLKKAGRNHRRSADGRYEGIGNWWEGQSRSVARKIRHEKAQQGAAQ